MFRTRHDANSAAETGSQEVVEYMSTLNGDTHETMGAGVVHDPRTNTWHQRQDLAGEIDIEEIYADYSEAQEQFMRTANKCLKKLKQPPMETSLVHDWKSVQTSMEKACAALDKASSRDKTATGLAGKLKKCYRSMCNNASSGNLFVTLIPGDGFGSVLSGGLGIVFNAMEQTGFHREAVYKALERLPRILDSHLEYTRLASEDKEIHRYTAKLYTEICRTLEHILQWFMMDAFVAGAKHLFKPSGFSTSLNDRMEEVHLAAKDLKTCGLQTMWRQTKQMHSENLRQTQRLEASIAQLSILNNSNNSSSSPDQQQILSEATATLDRRLGGIDHQMSQLLLLNHRADSYQDIELAVYKSLQPLLQGAMKRLVSTNTSPHYSQPSFLLSPPPPSQNKKKTGTIITPSSLLFQTPLSYSPDLIPSDLKHLNHLSLPSSSSSSSPSFSGLSIPLIHSLQRSPRLRAWLGVDEPRLLLVNGNRQGGGGVGGGAGGGDMSISVAAGGIVGGLLLSSSSPSDSNKSQNAGQRRRRRRGGGGREMDVITLSFFCGLHRDFRRDKVAGSVAGMVRSLLGQLVEGWFFGGSLGVSSPSSPGIRRRRRRRRSSSSNSSGDDKRRRRRRRGKDYSGEEGEEEEEEDYREGKEEEWEEEELVMLAECCDGVFSTFDEGVGGWVPLYDDYNDGDDDDDRWEEEEEDDIEGMMEVLARLIWRLPESAVVYLVLDGLEGFATPRERMEDLVLMVGMLVDLWREEPPATLKFMFLCAGRARFVEGLFDDEEVLDLPAVPPPSGGRVL